MTVWSRSEIAERVDALAAEHDGPAFVEEVERFAAELDDDGRKVLGEVLVKRAGREGLDYGLIRRIDEPRWKLLGRPPREPGR